MKKIFLFLLLLGSLITARAQTYPYGVYAGTNWVIAPGYFLTTTQLIGTLPNSVLPTNTVPYGLFSAGTNFCVTNDAALNLSLSNALAGIGLFNTNYLFTNYVSRITITSNFLSTNLLAQLNSASNFLGTNGLGLLNNASNYVATNGIGILNLASNALAVSIAATAFNMSAATNAQGSNITAAVSYTLGVSNGAAAYAFGISNNQATVSASATNYSMTVSNSLKSYVIGVSNLISQGKAFACTVPATYSSIGIGFSTPLMPDANYSVVLEPQDQATAEAPAHGLFRWPGAYTSSGFTIYLSYATNAYDLNFRAIIQKNTQ